MLSDLEKAEAAAERGDTAALVAALGQIRPSEDWSCEIYARYAALLDRAGLSVAAEQAYREAAAAKAPCRAALTGLGVLYLEQNRLDLACEALERARNLAVDAPVLVLLACIARERRDLPSAETLIEAALQLEPKNDEALFLHGRLLAARGELEAACAQMEAAIRREANDVRYRELSLSRWMLGDFAGALRAALAAVRIDGRDPFNLDQLGRVRWSLGEHAAAIATLERAVSAADGQAWFRCTLAEAYEAEGRVDDARIQFLEALASDPKDADTVRRYGMFLGRRGAELDACDHLRWAREAGNQAARRFLDRAAQADDD